MDKFYNQTGSCVATMSSMTLAFKAKRLMESAEIPCEIISLLPQESKNGCAYGLQYDCAAERQVRSLLRSSRIPVAQYLKRGKSL